MGIGPILDLCVPGELGWELGWRTPTGCLCRVGFSLLGLGKIWQIPQPAQ